jgi:putative zinc finger/helix-turn-helix YgiT family protein
MKLYYCDACDKDVPTRVEERTEVLPVIGEPTEVLSVIRICLECGEDICDDELDTATLRKAYDIYRQRHNLIMPEQLKQLRELYGLSQRSLAALLGWGEVTVHRYENGSLPDEAHNQLLHLLKYPENMLRIAEMNGKRLHASARKKLFARLTDIMGNGRRKSVAMEIHGAVHASEPKGKSKVARARLKKTPVIAKSNKRTRIARKASPDG